MSEPDSVKSVEEFISKRVQPEYRSLVAEFRKLVKAKFPELKEEMRGGTEAYYGTPAYRYNRIIAVISPSKQGITFAFSKGASFEDKYGLLEGVGNATRNVRVSKLEDFDEEAMKYYLKQAVEFDKK